MLCQIFSKEVYAPVPIYLADSLRHHFTATHSQPWCFQRCPALLTFLLISNEMPERGILLLHSSDQDWSAKVTMTTAFCVTRFKSILAIRSLLLNDNYMHSLLTQIIADPLCPVRLTLHLMKLGRLLHPFHGPPKSFFVRLHTYLSHRELFCSVFLTDCPADKPFILSKLLPSQVQDCCYHILTWEVNSRHQSALQR